MNGFWGTLSTFRFLLRPVTGSTTYKLNLHRNLCEDKSVLTNGAGGTVSNIEFLMIRSLVKI